MDKTFASREALILAGGLGTRLRPLVSDRPKALAVIGGRPFLVHLLDQLAEFGWQRVILCVGYLGEQIRSTLGDRHGPLALAYSPEHEPLGTGGALRQAMPMLGATHALVMNGDSFCDIDLAALASAHAGLFANDRRQATMAVLHREDRRQSGAVDVDADGRVVTFSSRPADGNPGLINAGVYMFHRDVLDAIPQGRPVSLEAEVLPALAARGVLFGWLTDGDFIDIGTPESYRAAQAFFADR